MSSELPWTVRVKGPPAGSGFEPGLPQPQLVAVAVMDWPWKVMVIFSAGESSPHTWMGASRCRTAWSVITLASRNSARTGCTHQPGRSRGYRKLELHKLVAPEYVRGSRNNLKALQLRLCRKPLIGLG